jgi:hypothetical protein
VLAIVSFDEVGAYSPVMNFDTNLLFFHVNFAGLLGPRLNVFNESFFYTATTGGFSLDPATFVHTESPAGRPPHFGWFATTSGGTFVTGYRWMLDGNVGDDRPRENEDTDLNRWSRYSAQTLGVDLPVFNPSGVSETHFLYIEAQDNNSQISMVVVQFHRRARAVRPRPAVRGRHARFRRPPGRGGCVDRPRGVWPDAAEMDTFFFARGGRPWRCYPAGTVSPTGLFQGYNFDTLGTRFLPQGTLTLQQLSHYRHVVWYTDFKGSLNINDPFLTQDPMSELRWLTLPGRSNPLGTWISQGGEVWMFGGGAASALQRNFEKSGTASDVYSSTDGELGPGRFMYDVFGWRSRSARSRSRRRRSHPHSISRSADSLDYPCSRIPCSRSPRHRPDQYLCAEPDLAGGLLPGAPWSARGHHEAERVFEDRSTDPTVIHQESVLDTVYESVGGQMGAPRPVMTVFHGGRNGQRQVFSGFQLWYWRREQQLAIADFVLQKVWNMPRQPVPR